MGAQHVLLVVDCHSTMFAPFVTSDTSGEPSLSSYANGGSSSGTSSARSRRRGTTRPFRYDTPMDVSLGIAQQFVRQRIRTVVTHKTGKRDGVGIVLYNTKPIVGTNDKKHKNIVQTDTSQTNDNDMEGDDDDDDEETDVDDDDDDDEDAPATTANSIHVLLPLQPPGIQQVRTI